MIEKHILFIHGAHVTSRCWERFIPFFEEKGYRCTAPDWPYDDRPVADLRADPAPELGRIGVTEIIDHYEKLVREMAAQPVLIGHSYGGLFTQMLLDRGLGAAGVALDPAPPKGVLPTPAAFRSNFAPLAAWSRGRKTVRMTEKDFGRFFANGIPAAERAQAYRDQVVPTPVRIFLQSAAAPFHHVTEVDYRRPQRAPLLITAGGKDRQVPASMNRANFRRYSNHAGARVEFMAFPERSHALILEPGWEQVAEAVAGWLERVLK